MDSPGYMKHSDMTRNHAQSIKMKEKRGLRTPHTALCKFVGGAIHWTFEHTFVSTKASHSEGQRLNYTASNVVNSQPRNSHIHACQLHKKKLHSGQKTYSSLFLLAFFDLGRQNPSSLKTERPGSE